jgi:hypothetical protein
MKFRFLLLGFLISFFTSATGQIAQIGNGGFVRSDYGPMFIDTLANSYGRFAYIYPSETLGDLVHGDSISAIGFKHPANDSLRGSCNFKIYLKTTHNSDFGSGSINWLAETRDGMTLVYDGSPNVLILPNREYGVFQFNEVTSFRFDTSDAAINLQVLIEFTQEDPQTLRHTWYCENGFTVPEFTSSNETKYVKGYGTSLDSFTNLSTVIKPSIKLFYPREDEDLYIENVYGLKKAPVLKNMGEDVFAEIYNAGKSDVSNYAVYLNGSGANSLRDTFTIPFLAKGANTVVTFSNYVSSKEGPEILQISLQDNNGGNNTKDFARSITYNEFSYVESNSSISSFFGLDGSKTDYVARFNSKELNQITSVGLKFNTVGVRFKIGVWSSDENQEPDTLVYLSNTLFTSTGSNEYNLSNVNVQGDFFVGVRQDTSVNIGLGAKELDGKNAGLFYFNSNINQDHWNDLSTTQDAAFIINPKIKNGNDIKVLSIEGVSELDSFIYDPGDSMEVGVTLVNLGYLVQTGYGIKLQLIDRFNQVVYQDSITGAQLLDTLTTYFNKISKNIIGTFKLRVTTISTFDKIVGNNEAELNFTIANNIDAAVNYVFEPFFGDSIYIKQDGFEPRIRVINYGLKKQNNIPVTVQLLKNNQVLSTETQNVSLNSNFSKIMVFDSIFPQIPGDLLFIAFTSLDQDSFTQNDTFIVPVFGLVKDDIGIDSTVLPLKDGRYLVKQSHAPIVTLSNNGEQDQINFSVKLIISNEEDQIVYRDSIITFVGSHSTRSVSFKHFNFSNPGKYLCQAIAVNPNDQDKTNDTLITSFQMVENYNLNIKEVVIPAEESNITRNSNPTYPKVVIENTGFVNANNVEVYSLIWDDFNNIIFQDTILVSIAEGSAYTYSFSKLLSYNDFGTYSIEITHNWVNESKMTKNDTLNSIYYVLNSKDLGVEGHITPVQGDSVILGSLVNTKTRIKNIGIDTIKDIKIHVHIRNPLNEIVLKDTLFYSSLVLNDAINLQSSKFYTPDTVGEFTVESIYYGIDDSSTNNTFESSFIVYKKLDLLVDEIVFPLNDSNLYINRLYKPQVRIKNDGLDSIDLATISCRVYIDGNQIYHSSKLAEIGSGKYLDVDFDSTLQHHQTDQAIIEFTLIAQGDNYNRNDTLSGTFNFVDNSSISEVDGLTLSVYPNPFSNKVTVQSVSKIEKIRVYSANGMLLEEHSPRLSKFVFSLNSESSGVYYIEVFTALDRTQIKLIKIDK